MFIITFMSSPHQWSAVLLIEVSVVFVGLNMIVMAAVVYLQAAAVTKPVEHYQGLGLDALELSITVPTTTTTTGVVAASSMTDNNNEEVKAITIGVTSSLPSSASSSSIPMSRGWQSYNTRAVRLVIFALDLAILIAYGIIVQVESVNGKGVGWLTLAAVSVLGTLMSLHHHSALYTTPSYVNMLHIVYRYHSVLMCIWWQD
jgi:hypothetical protein